MELDLIGKNSSKKIDLWEPVALFPYYEEDEVKKVKYHSICHKRHISL